MAYVQTEMEKNGSSGKSGTEKMGLVVSNQHCSGERINVIFRSTGR